MSRVTYQCLPNAAGGIYSDEHVFSGPEPKSKPSPPPVNSCPGICEQRRSHSPSRFSLLTDVPPCSLQHIFYFTIPLPPPFSAKFAHTLSNCSQSMFLFAVRKLSVLQPRLLSGYFPRRPPLPSHPDPAKKHQRYPPLLPFSPP